MHLGLFVTFEDSAYSTHSPVAVHYILLFFVVNIRGHILLFKLVSDLKGHYFFRLKKHLFLPYLLSFLAVLSLVNKGIVAYTDAYKSV